MHLREGADRAVERAIVVSKHQVQREHHLTILLNDARIEDTIQIQSTVTDTDRELDQSEYLIYYGFNFVFDVVKLTAVNERFNSIANDRSDCIDNISDHSREVTNTVEVSEWAGL